MASIYLIGSLRNPALPLVGNKLREAGWEVFDDWHGAGPHADDEWQKYEKQRGRTYKEALNGHAAWNTFRFDHRNLNRVDSVLLVLPTGKSGHLEFGYGVGLGKKGYILFDQEPERWDVMYRFAGEVFFSQEEMMEYLCPEKKV